MYSQNLWENRDDDGAGLLTQTMAAYLDCSPSFRILICWRRRQSRTRLWCRQSRDRAAAWVSPVSALFPRFGGAFGTSGGQSRPASSADERADDDGADSAGARLTSGFCWARNRCCRRPEREQNLRFPRQKELSKRKLTGMTLMSDTPEPVSLRSRSLSGSASRESALFFKIDLERLCVSLDDSASENG